ncbi:Alpha/Beta hydrolase protein [Aspergillus californicus]
MSPIQSPLDPDLVDVHKNIPRLDVNTPEKLHPYREVVNTMFSLETTMKGHEATVSALNITIPGPTGPMPATIFRPKTRTLPIPSTPGILHIHGGGLATGNRFLGLTMLDWVEKFGAVILTAEYRLAPEFPAPAGLEDTYAALSWMASNASDPALGFNPSKLLVAGGSAGGNLAAGVALLARDRAFPALAGQILMYPWVSDSITATSVDQYGDLAPVTKEDVITITDYAYGKDRQFADMYTAPMRAESLAGLPPAFIDVGEADVFRDQDVEYAVRLLGEGVATELHVWPGCYHGFDVFVPGARVSGRARAAREEWVGRVLGIE